MKQHLSDNLIQLRGQIADACDDFDRDVDDITIVAVSKTHPARAISRAVAAGIHNIGESRIQEAEPKILEVGQIARFHMIGHLQTNKVKKAVELFDVIQSVDSLKLAEEIEKRSAEIDRTIECYLEVNCSGEENKFGFRPEETIEMLKRINEFSRIKLTGLMTIAPLTEDEEAIRSAFRQCHDLYREGRELLGQEFDTLSMGMSDDFSLAIAEGSTMIRIGTAIFGPRQPREED